MAKLQGLSVTASQAKFNNPDHMGLSVLGLCPFSGGIINSLRPLCEISKNLKHKSIHSISFHNLFLTHARVSGTVPGECNQLLKVEHDLTANRSNQDTCKEIDVSPLMDILRVHNRLKEGDGLLHWAMLVDDLKNFF